MSDNFQKKTSSFIVTALIGLIIVSFMFSGYQSMRGTPDTVAKVGGIPIKVDEFQNEYHRQIQFYSRLFGDKALSSKQIEQFGIKKNALKSLITQKLMIKFADTIGVVPATDEVKDEIKELPYFKKDDKFDIGLYKMLLQRNNMTPSSFEESIEANVKLQKTRDLTSQFPLSKQYMDELVAFKAHKIKAQLIQFSKKSLQKFINVPSKEIDQFLANSENLVNVQSIFAEKKDGYDQPEKVRARHILLKTSAETENEVKEKMDTLLKKLTLKNFKKMADKYTEDQAGKGNGGNLGEFGRGKMVPEFEDVAFNLKPGTISTPVKTQFGYHIILVEDKIEAKNAQFDDYKNELVTDLLRKEKTVEQQKLVEELTDLLKKHVANNDYKIMESLQKDYDFKYEKDQVINQLDGTKGRVTLRPDQMQEIFSKIDRKDEISIFDNIVDITLVKAEKIKEEKDKNTSVEKERTQISTDLANKLSQDIIKMLEDQVKVKVYGNII